MIITWLGLSNFKITVGDLTLVTDPFSKTVGLLPPRMQTDVAVISNTSNPAYNNRESLGGESVFVIDGPGEFDVKGLFIHGIAATNSNQRQNHDKLDATTIYMIKMEDIRLGFLGSIKQKELTDEQTEALGEIDILFAPVGGVVVCDAEESLAIVNQLEPHLVIPMHYSQKGVNLKLDKVDQFLKEIGSRPDPLDRLTIKKSQITNEKTEVILLNPQR